MSDVQTGRGFFIPGACGALRGGMARGGRVGGELGTSWRIGKLRPRKG